MPKPENVINNGFKEHPERINRNGQPRKMVSQVIHDLKQQGIEAVTRSQVIACNELLMNCTGEQLQDLANDKESNWLIRQTAKYMLKNSDKAWNELQDRTHGKPSQAYEIAGRDGEPLKITVEHVHNESDPNL